MSNREFFSDLPDTTTPIRASRLNGLLNGKEAMGTIVVDDINCKNMFNKGATVDGYFINASGVVTADASSFYGDFIEITPNTDYYISGRTASSGIILYDSSKTFIERVYTTNANDVFKTTNTNVKYIRLNGNLTDKNTIQFEKGSTATTYTPYKKLIKDVGGYVKEDNTFYANDFKCKNLFTGTASADRRINPDNGGSGGATGYSMSNFIEVKPNTTYALTTGGSSYYSWYTSNDYSTYISGGTWTNQASKTSPANAKYIRFDYLTSNVGNVQLEIGEATPYTPYQQVFEEVYSTGEMKIGTWLGKPLYRKVIDIGAMPNNTSKTVAHNISSVDTWVTVRAIAQTSGPVSLLAPSYNGTIYTNIYTDYQNVYVQTNGDRSGFSGYVILEYTKN